MTEPGITVVTPVWGEYARFLPKLADTLEPFFLECERSIGAGKMLIIDNHSGDPIEAPTSRCEVIRTDKRLSVGAARNRGLERVQTSAVAFVDADDQPHVRAFVDVARAFYSAQAPIAGVFPAVHRPDPAGGSYLGAWPHRPAVTLSRWPRGFALLNMFINELPVTQGAVLNTSLVREVGGFADLNYGEDWVLGARLAFGGRIRFLPQVQAVTYSQGALSRREGRSAVLSGYDAVTREIAGSPSVPRWARRLLAGFGSGVNRIRVAFEFRQGAGGR